MAQVRIWFTTAIALSALFTTLLPAQEYPKAQKVTQTDPASNDESPTPTPKPKGAKSKAKPKKTPSPTPRKSPTPKPKSKKPKSAEDEEGSPPPKAKARETSKEKSATPSESETPTPTPKPKSTKKKPGTKKEPSPSRKKKSAKTKHPLKQKEEGETPAPPKAVKAPSPAETPVERPTAPPARAVAVPTPAGPPAPAYVTPPDANEEPEQLNIEKYGYEKPRGFWSRLFGGGGRRSSGAGYRYLTRSVRGEIDRAPADSRNPRWQFIVVHNSGTRQGNARVFDYYHRHVRHMQNGLAYHFVIGNGTSTGNGQIEVGDRWRRQINGGHVHSDHLNNIALGICLVGDFNRDQPTRAQLECCEELIRYLRQHCGKVDNHFPIVKPHREMNPPRWATDCPGDAFPYSWFRRF